ncbi:hypothetical protein BVG16_14350 [Paenibacillus selenitireducens]|uniref:Aminodeoxychorismate lyase n=1 Tax=Paenibacillus selenitireducens TaxID=1324314 RepID=A0A1T2XDD1_9BACL|nr:hypothetical protein [Paenibacillus selenitireducens]OPA77623.1 hypothetical protein BVG16_14350 [Paenibacillus selenitireducens]
MFKNRNFLLGLGIGLISGGILLQLMLIGTSGQAASNISNDLDSLTDAQLESYAAKLDMQVYPKETKLYTEQELQEKLVQQETKLKASQKPVEQPAAAKNAESKSDSSPAKEESDSKVSKESNDTKDTKETSLRITSGVTLTQVSKELKRLGLISSVTDFVSYGKKKNITANLQTGTYVFVGTPTYAEIAARITEKSK